MSCSSITPYDHGRRQTGGHPGLLLYDHNSPLFHPSYIPPATSWPNPYFNAYFWPQDSLFSYGTPMFDTCLQPALSNGTLDGYQYYMAEQEAHVSGLEVNTAFDPKQHTATLELQEATDQVSDSNQSADPSEGQHLLAHFSAAEAQAVSPIVTESEEDLVESVLHSLRQAKESGDRALLQSDFVFKQDSVDFGVQLVVEDLDNNEPDHESDLEDTDLLLGRTLKQLMNNTLRFPGIHKIVVRSSKSSMKILSEHQGVQ